MKDGLSSLDILLSKCCQPHACISKGRGRLFRRKDGKYLIYLPKDLAEDSMFPFKTETSVRVKVAFGIGEQTLTIKKYEQETV